ncbi:hypothetical protein CDCA_CDCA03G0906 [Cyanidium caldarium]|uniref:Polycomb protein VEFS-Box domain-containing protein n=1 Tax=Cyanidium caldarium TaxID=2771 RepID=A0AAV9IS34_CYACA|nr:hypothetical protein CDCA_CDCA03G0906 [Cyanidium caldarium]
MEDLGDEAGRESRSPTADVAVSSNTSGSPGGRASASTSTASRTAPPFLQRTLDISATTSPNASHPVRKRQRRHCCRSLDQVAAWATAAALGLPPPSSPDWSRRLRAAFLEQPDQLRLRLGPLWLAGAVRKVDVAPWTGSRPLDWSAASANTSGAGITEHPLQLTLALGDIGGVTNMLGHRPTYRCSTGPRSALQCSRRKASAGKTGTCPPVPWRVLARREVQVPLRSLTSATSSCAVTNARAVSSKQLVLDMKGELIGLLGRISRHEVPVLLLTETVTRLVVGWSSCNDHGGNRELSPVSETPMVSEGVCGLLPLADVDVAEWLPSGTFFIPIRSVDARAQLLECSLEWRSERLQGHQNAANVRPLPAGGRVNGGDGSGSVAPVEKSKDATQCDLLASTAEQPVQRYRAWLTQQTEHLTARMGNGAAAPQPDQHPQCTWCHWRFSSEERLWRHWDDFHHLRPVAAYAWARGNRAPNALPSPTSLAWLPGAMPPAVMSWPPRTDLAKTGAGRRTCLPPPLTPTRRQPTTPPRDWFMWRRTRRQRAREVDSGRETCGADVPATLQTSIPFTGKRPVDVAAADAVNDVVDDASSICSTLDAGRREPCATQVAAESAATHSRRTRRANLGLRTLDHIRCEAPPTAETMTAATTTTAPSTRKRATRRTTTTTTNAQDVPSRKRQRRWTEEVPGTTSRLFDRTYYHSMTLEPMTRAEVLSDYDSEVDGLDDAWVLRVAEQRLEQFTDVLPEENLLMRWWNAFIHRQPTPRSDRSVREAGVAFAAQLGTRCARGDAGCDAGAMRAALLMHLKALWHFHLVDVERLHESLTAFDTALAERATVDKLKAEHGSG